MEKPKTKMMMSVWNLMVTISKIERVLSLQFVRNLSLIWIGGKYLFWPIQVRFRYSINLYFVWKLITLISLPIVTNYPNKPESLLCLVQIKLLRCGILTIAIESKVKAIWIIVWIWEMNYLSQIWKECKWKLVHVQMIINTICKM